MGWFSKQENSWRAWYQPEEVDYPSGSAVETAGRFWYIKGKTKFSIPTNRILESWKFNSVALTAEQNLDKYKNVGTLGFREGTLIYNYADSRVYLISDNKRRWIVSPDVYEKYGLNPESIIEVSDDEANLHDDGEVLK